MEQEKTAQDIEKREEERHEERQKVEKKQLNYQRLQFFMTCLSTLFMAAPLLVVLGAVGYILPRFNAMYASAMVSLGNLEELTNSLNEADIAGTIKHADELTMQAATDLSGAMEKLNSVDIESLNRSIRNLNDSVEPFASFFRTFGR